MYTKRIKVIQIIHILFFYNISRNIWFVILIDKFLKKYFYWFHDENYLQIYYLTIDVSIGNIIKFIGYPAKSIGLKFILSQSELFRFIPISVSEPMRIIPNQSEKRFVPCLKRNDKKSIIPNPI